MKEITGPALVLTNGTRYAAIVHVHHARWLVSASAVESRFGELGFVDVSASLEQPPSTWTWGTAPVPDSGFLAYVVGTWGRESMTLPRPEEIVRAWDLGPAGGGPVAWKEPEPSDKVNPLGTLLMSFIARAIIKEVFG